MELVEPLEERPLPVKWDGRDVTWDEFTLELMTSMEFHMTAAQRRKAVCAKCGTPDRERVHSTGTVHPLPGETMEGTVRRRSKRTGKMLHVPTMVPAWPLRTLVAWRCVCGLDTVWDMDKEEWWELDESDYGPDGSSEELRLF
jgi:hypothetical protein